MTNISIDLRSDTVTKPTPGMLDAMISAPVGDDVFGEDPTIDNLERKTAALFGKEAGLFCPSGTMTNQIAINILTRPRDEIICDHTSHVYLYEGGGLAFNSGISTWLLQGDRGRISAEQVHEAIRPDNIHNPRISLVEIENTHNRGGGSIYKLEDIIAIRKICDANGLKMHLDGARIFNALEETDYNAVDIGKHFNTISVCFSKGLGAPVGSVLLASADLIKEAKRVRKVWGGGMRQAGFIAAAGIYALDHHITRLSEDHLRAKVLGQTLSSLSFVDEVIPVETNIVISRLNNSMQLDAFLKLLANKNIKAVAFGKQSVRMVTHLDFTDEMLDYTCRNLKNL